MDKMDDNVLNYQPNCDYQTLKRMKKLWGKHRGREIALGRLLVKTMLQQYGKLN